VDKHNKFEIHYRDAAGRAGIFHTSHGDLETPVLLPVINPNLDDCLSSKEIVRTFRPQALMTNSYIIYKSPNLREKALKSGVHGLLDYDGVVMTDSGTFQMYVYGGVDVTPDEIVDFQREMGSDILTMLDLFTKPDEDRAKANSDIEENLLRAEAASRRKGKSALAGTIQGGMFPDLRQRCAQQMSRLDCDVHPIGGVVPIMENYWYRTLAEVIIAAKQGLTPERPVHLFGAGHPMVFPLAAALGCDMFDSSSYAKYAQQGRMMFETGTRSLEDLEALPCECPVCSATSPNELRSLDERERARQLALHNLHVSFGTIRKVKQAMAEGSLWEMVERTARAHPHLLEALDVIARHKDLLEQTEPLSKRRFFYTGPESLNRPDCVRYTRRYFNNYRLPKADVMILFDGGLERKKPYYRHVHDVVEKVSKDYNCTFMVTTPFGPVPLELDSMYPIGQSVMPDVADLPPDEIRRLKAVMASASHKMDFKAALVWEGEKTLSDLATLLPMGKGSYDFGLQKVMAVCDYQFGPNAADAILGGSDGFDLKKRVELIRSKNTGMIRNVLVDGEHVLSMRAEDGLFTLKLAGARRIMKHFPMPRLRVVVDKDSFEFNKQGKNVFAPFVKDADPELRPGDEAIIVSEDDELAAVGKAMLNRREMLAFRSGIAVKTRGSLSSPEAGPEGAE